MYEPHQLTLAAKGYSEKVTILFCFSFKVLFLECGFSREGGWFQNNFKVEKFETKLKIVIIVLDFCFENIFPLLKL